MKIASWNVNGIRAREAEVLAWLADERPDVACLQEIKAPRDKVPQALREHPAYVGVWHGERAYSGVALLVHRECFALEPRFSHPEFDHDARVAAATAGRLEILSVYVPQRRQGSGREAALPARARRVRRRHARARQGPRRLRRLRRVARATYVRSFEMRNEKGVTDYFLFFATNSQLGMQRMKEAMWKVDQSGEFRFSDATNPAQRLLFSQGPDFDELRRLILSKFAGGEATVGKIEDFVLADTPFRETHYKKQVLAALEREGKVAPVNLPRRRKAGTYADASMVLRFAR